MNSAQARAQEIRRRYHFAHPQDIERVLAREHLLVERRPFAGRIDEMVVYNHIGIQASLGDPRRIRELLAHALGHHLLHAGNQPFDAWIKDRVRARQMEQQAWAFAYELLMPARKLIRLLRKEWSDDDLRDCFDVSEDFYRRRLDALRGELPARPPLRRKALRHEGKGTRREKNGTRREERTLPREARLGEEARFIQPENSPIPE